jgi:hypothetical protein
MLVLQSCTDSQQNLPGFSSESFPTSDGACSFSNTEVEEDVVVIEQGFIAADEEAAVRIKQEEIVEDITFPDIKSEADEVSYVCTSVIRHILPLSKSVRCFCDVSIYDQLKQLTVGNEYVLLSFYLWE